ncbi:tyrosine-type recombinase/integrase [Effusibacillus consociatus]|uniref:Tyrosine-type recombinase/integrase n=1 Tax=Effusibacillus consociatus TaxID=1117041 RepID=A0ABV9PZP8_9BACL
MTLQTRRRKNTLTTSKTANSILPQKEIKLEEVVKSFVLDCRARNLSSRTIQFYQEVIGCLQKTFQEQGLKFDVTTVTQKDLKHHFIGYMLEKGIASNTVNGRIKGCKAFFKFLFQERFISDNLADQLELIKAEKKMIQTFTKEQVIQLLNLPNRDTFTGLRDYTIMLILLETGMRLSELVALTVSDVNLKEFEIRILSGKGRKARRVPIQKTCTQVLKRYLLERGDVETDALFINIDNGPLHLRTIQDMISSYGKAAQITGVRVSPHTFRHTMAKFYILNGGDVFTLQQILGHTTLDMVRYYVELFSSDIKKQHQKYSPVENMTRRRNVV